jgi:hypothetical protein
MDLLSPSDVARVAGVGASAVSNWRKRYDDFPEPILNDGQSVAFDRIQIETWLVAHGKSVGELPLASHLWSLLERARGAAPIQQVILATAGLIACLDVTGGRSTPGEGAWWPLLEPLPPKVIDQLADGIGTLPNHWTALTVFESALALRTRLGSVAEFGHSTQSSLVELLVAVAAGSGTIIGPLYDPVVGEGHLLARAATHVRGKAAILGQEIDPTALALARCRFLLMHREAELVAGNTLTDPAHDGSIAGTVLCDPPYGMTLPRPLDWSPRWKYGTPKRADLAFILHAQHALKSEGRALVITSESPLFQRGGDERIRSALIADGLIASVTALGPGLAGHTSIPLFMWELRGAPVADSQVLLIEAAAPPLSGRARRELAPELIAAVEQVIRTRPKPSELVEGVRYTYASAKALLAEGADLTPSRWLQVRLDRTQPVHELAVAEKDQGMAQARLHDVPFATPMLGPERDQLASIAQLLDEGAVSILRPLRYKEEDVRGGGTPGLVKVSDVRNGYIAEPKTGVDHVDPDEVSQPGDVFVVPEGVVRAAVDTTGGYVTRKPVVRLRSHSAAVDPYVLASAISAPVNERAKHGTTIPRLDLLQVRVPRMTVEEAEVAGRALRRSYARRQALSELVDAEARADAARIQTLFTHTWTA